MPHCLLISEVYSPALTQDNCLFSQIRASICGDNAMIYFASCLCKIMTYFTQIITCAIFCVMSLQKKSKLVAQIMTHLFCTNSYASFICKQDGGDNNSTRSNKDSKGHTRLHHPTPVLERKIFETVCIAILRPDN